MPFGPSHRFLRKAARYTMEGFFSEVLVVDGEQHVPVDGPLIVCCTHWNMIVDVSERASPTSALHRLNLSHVLALLP